MGDHPAGTKPHRQFDCWQAGRPVQTTPLYRHGYHPLSLSSSGECMQASCFPLTPSQQDWQVRAAEVARNEIGPRAAEVDRLARYPDESLAALRRAGFFSMRVGADHGGAEADLLSVCLVIEAVARHCASTAMCFKMHLEATELLNRIATPDQVERFVRPLQRGEMLATVAGSETAGASGRD